MAPVPKTKTQTINHFAHPGHDLSVISKKGEYLCGACKTPGGKGARYSCHTCDFNMHEYCASCPSTLSSFMHHHHQLNLVLRTQGVRQNQRVCDLCGDAVEGLFYRCKICDFDVHPLCTQLPQYVGHSLHPDHQLRLQPFASGWCAVCRGACSSWRYRCDTCGFDIHLECMLVPCHNSTTSRSVWPPGPPPHFHGGAPQPPYGAPVYGYPPGYVQAEGGGRPSNGKRLGKIMFALVGKLTIGVLSNVLF